MLGKLMKYEWQATWKLLVPTNLLIIVMTFFACLTVRLDGLSSRNEGVVFSAGMILAVYVLSMFVALIGTAIYLIYRFYTSTYGDQGYLLHTLPVDKHHIIIAKVLVSQAWVMISAFLMYVSILFLFNAEKDIMTDFIDGLKVMVAQTIDERVSAFAVVMAFIAVIVSMLARVLKVTACISLGQLSSNHKLLVAFAFYFAIYISQQVVATLYYVFSGYINRTRSWNPFDSWEFVLIIELIYSVVFYLLTWYVMDRKLNLD